MNLPAMPRWLAIVAAATLSGCAHNSLYEPSDPLEPVNRSIYAFNTTADRYVLRPVTKGYVYVVPSPVRRGVTNFLDNLGYPVVVVNDLLQLKLTQAARDTGRFLLNTTYGLAGFLDPATLVGLKKNDEDLGQTFGHWGVGEGWYLMLPLLGPTTNRDVLGKVGDMWLSPLQYVDSYDTPEKIVVAGARAIDIRAKLLELDSVLEQQLDPYVFVRTAYLQRRMNLVYDGNAPMDLLEPELPED
ncbi:MAG: VacJ family lipoprotein [Sinimarinibacterium sp.]|jgi:phospholipid-binding lipoprotein MlaA